MAKQNLIERLLDVRRSEWRTLIWLMLFFFTESIASEILDIVALAGVLKGGGLRSLPVLYIFDETLLAAILAVYAILVNRVERTRLFNLMEATFGTLIIFLYFGSRAGIPPVLIGIGTYAVKSLAISILEENFWMFVDDIYDVREAKRLTPVITTSGVVGGIVGAAGLGLVSGTIITDLNTFRLIAPVVMFSGIFFMTRVRKAALAEGRLTLEEGASAEQKDKKKKKDKKKPSFKEGVSFIRKSPMFNTIFWTFVVAGVVAPLGDVVFQATADLYAADEEAYARFLAFYKTGLTIFIFFAQLLLSGRLMKRLGISNSQLLSPINNLLKYALFIPFVNLPVAIYAQGSKKLVEKILQKPAQRILFGFAPKQQKNTVRVFTKQMKGYAAIATLCLIWIVLQLMPDSIEDISQPAVRLSFIRGIALLLIGLNLFWLFQSLRLKRVFAQSLVEILQSQEIDFEALERADFRGLIDEKTLMFLWKNLEAGSDKRAVFITEVLGEVGDARLLRPIADLMPHKGPEVRRALVRLAGRVGGDEARPFLLNALRSREAGVRAEALKAIGNNEYDDIYDHVRTHVEDGNEEVRVAAAAIMLHSQEVKLKKEGARVLDAMLHSPDPRRRVNALYLLGQMGVKRNIRAVVPFFADPDFEVRLEALKSLAALADRSDQALTPDVARLLSDPSPEVRVEAIAVLGITGSEQSVAPLKQALAQPGFAVQRAAVAALAALGAAGREALIGAVADPRVGLQTKELIVRELRNTDEADRLRQHLIGPLGELLRNLYTRIADREALVDQTRGRPGTSFLVKSLQDSNQEIRDLVLSILIILADPDRYKLIRKGLLEGDRNTKANMLELLESTSERNLFNLLTPLLEDYSDAQRIDLARRTWGIKPRSPLEALQSCLASGNSCVRLAAIYAVGELRQTSLAPEVDELLRSSDPAVAREAKRTAALLRRS